MRQRLSPEQATAQGYEALTVPYRPGIEDWMLENVVKDMKKGNKNGPIDWILVEETGERFTGLAVWRKGLIRSVDVISTSGKPSEQFLNDRLMQRLTKR